MNYASTIFRNFKYELIKVLSFLLIFAVTLLYVISESNRVYETDKNRRIMNRQLNDMGIKKDLIEINRN